jgi:hypothetical protein
MPRKTCSIREYGVISDDAVVRDMARGHNEIMIAHARDASAFRRSAIHRAKLANDIRVPDFKPGRFASKANMLGRLTDGRELENSIGATDSRRTIKHDMRTDPGFVADYYSRSNDAEWTNMHVTTQFGAGIDQRLRVNHSHISISAHDPGAATEFIVNERAGVEHPNTAHFSFDRRLDFQLIARFNRPLEACFVDAHKIIDSRLTRRGIQTFCGEQRAGLGNGFDNEHARHHGSMRKMSLKKRLINGDVFQSQNPLVFRKFQHAIDQ